MSEAKRQNGSLPTPASRLRDLLAGNELVVAPGAYDCITARLIERSGFPVAYMTGAGSAAALGYPDYGLVTMTEMVGNAARIATAIGIPVIADADTGYGNELNTIRTIREFEKCGVAGVHIEDQEFPKRCGHLEGKVVIARDDFVSKVRAAVAARRDPDFLIIARTDARAVLGFDEAVSRANAALAAGADMAFVEAPESVEEMSAIPKHVEGPCLLNLVWRGKTPDISLPEIQRMGYRLAIMPSVLIRGVVGYCEDLLDRLNRTGNHPRPHSDLTPQQSFSRFGADEWDRYRDMFARTSPRDGDGTAR